MPPKLDACTADREVLCSGWLQKRGHVSSGSMSREIIKACVNPPKTGEVA
jgi:hypothetical protein